MWGLSAFLGSRGVDVRVTVLKQFGIYAPRGATEACRTASTFSKLSCVLRDATVTGGVSLRFMTAGAE